MSANTNPGIIDAEVISVDWDDDKPRIKAHNVSPGKQAIVATAQRHLDGLSPARKAALKTIAKKAGIVGLTTYAASLVVPKITDEFAGEGDHHWACKPPERNRTSYYPVTGNGNYDDVSGVDKLDSESADLNKSTFGYDAELVRSFHDNPCLDGCVHTLTEPSTISADTADKYYADVHDLLGDTISDLNSAAGEPWVQTLIQQRYNTLSDRQDEVSTISTAAGKMLGSSNAAATEAHSLLRNTIKRTRADLANGYAHGQSGFSWTATAAGAAAGLKKGIVGAGIGAVGGGLISGLWGDKFPDDVKEALDTRLDDAASKAKAALGESDDDVEMFKTVVSEFGGDIRSGEGALDKATGVLGGLWDSITGAVDGILPDHIGDGKNPLGNLGDITNSPLGTSPSTDTPASPNVTSPSTPTHTPSTATPSSPLGTTQTPSMGTPSMSSPSMGATPTTPTSSMMTPAAFDQMMGTQPDTAAPERFEGTEVPTDDTTDPLGEDTTDPLGDEPDKSDDDDELSDPETVSDDAKSDDTKDDSDGEVVTDENGDPVTTPEPAAPEPTDEQKKTVQLPDGRQVTFPNEKLADMVRTMVASGTENPTSVYQAADAAGLKLPPMGQDIGTPVPPMDVQPGDVVKGPDGTGVAIGNGEVFMESGEVKPIEDVSTVDAAGHGIFRLETADATAPAPGAAPVQPIVPPAPVVGEQVQPPVPTAVQPPVPLVGEQQPATPAVSGDPLDLLAAV